VNRVGPWLLAALLAGCGTPERERPNAIVSSAKWIDRAPAEDRERSPHTGWTRAHYEAVFGRLLIGFVDHRSLAGARTRYPGGEQLPAAMEGATRMLPALGGWLGCDCNPDRVVVDGRELDVGAIARAIVLAGTDPNSPDYWHRSRGGWDQREVEAALVAEFLLRSRARVWDRLTVAEQEQIMAWLEPAEVPLAANWLAFQIGRNAARGALGYPASEQALREQLDRLEREYVGDGFYRDGHRYRFDWYNAFVIHAQLSLWRSLAPEIERERIDRIAARTREFIEHLPYLFDPRGAVAPIGRSLAYRSGALASVHASILAGDDFIEPGLARRISAGNLRFHVEAGMFGPDEVLTRGYHGDQPGVVDEYLRPGSQYFATHALSVLALPPEHPFWSATEQPLPADRGSFVHAIPAVGWMITHYSTSGLILHNVGASSPRYHEEYGKLGYPAQTWYARSSADALPYDSAVISATRGKFDQRRGSPQAWAVAPGFAWVRYPITPEGGGEQPHWISTAVLADPVRIGPESVRLSCIEPSSAEPARAYEGSFAIPLAGESRARGEERGPWFYLHKQGFPGLESGAVLLAGLYGWERAGRELDHPFAAEHVFGGPAGYVGLGVDGPFEQLRCFASMQVLDEKMFPPQKYLASAPKVAFSGTQATIENWDGTEVWVELAPELVERTVELGSVRATGPLRLLWVDDESKRVLAVGVRELMDEHGPLFERKNDEVRAIVELSRRRTSPGAR
jgi:hypothetical protein